MPTDDPPAAGPGAGDPFDTGPGPPRGAFLLAYAGVVLAGLLGGALGYAFAEASCRGDCTTDTVVGAIVGAVVAAVGVGVVAVLALRAMAEWRRPR
jgi:hypothetical protein